MIVLMHTDYFSGASTQLPPTVDPRVSQPVTFSKDMTIEQLSQWLRSHPSLTGTNYEEDISKLIGTWHVAVLVVLS